MDAVDRRREWTTLRDELRSAASLTELILDSKDIELLLLKNDVQNKLGHLTSDEEALTPPPATSKVAYQYHYYQSKATHMGSVPVTTTFSSQSATSILDASLLLYVVFFD